MCVRARAEVLHGRDMYAADGRFRQAADIHHIWYKTNKRGPNPRSPNDVSRGRPSKEGGRTHMRLSLCAQTNTRGAPQVVLGTTKDALHVSNHKWNGLLLQSTSIGIVV